MAVVRWRVVILVGWWMVEDIRVLRMIWVVRIGKMNK